MVDDYPLPPYPAHPHKIVDFFLLVIFKQPEDQLRVGEDFQILYLRFGLSLQLGIQLLKACLLYTSDAADE